MSATITMTTMEPPPQPPTPLSLSADPLSTSPSPSNCCPSCGINLPPSQAATSGKEEGEDAARSLLEAQSRIADMEAQIKLLNEKASAAVGRWAEYEEELFRLRKQADGSQQQEHLQQQQQQQQQQQLQPAPSPSPTRSSFLASSTGVANRLSALLSPRKSTPNLRPDSPSSSPPPNTSTNTTATIVATPQPATTPLASTSTPNLLAPTSPSANGPPSPSDEARAAADSSHPLNAHADLLSALHREQSLRRDAETRLSSTSKEVEELSVSLFEQANEMVATERRARAKLEERVEVLEQRDVDKRRRLDKLEGALGRIERVRALLGEERVRKMREEAGREKKNVNTGTGLGLART